MRRAPSPPAPPLAALRLAWPLRSGYFACQSCPRRVVATKPGLLAAQPAGCPAASRAQLVGCASRNPDGFLGGLDGALAGAAVVVAVAVAGGVSCADPGCPENYRGRHSAGDDLRSIADLHLCCLLCQTATMP